MVNKIKGITNKCDILLCCVLFNIPHNCPSFYMNNKTSIVRSKFQTNTTMRPQTFSADQSEWASTVSVPGTDRDPGVQSVCRWACSWPARYQGGGHSARSRSQRSSHCTADPVSMTPSGKIGNNDIACEKVIFTGSFLDKKIHNNQSTSILLLRRYR